MYEINMEKNIRDILKDTIFAHPDDIKDAVKKTTPQPTKKGEKSK